MIRLAVSRLPLPCAASCLCVARSGMMAGCNGASLIGETLHESASEMKRKAPGAQEPEHMGYM
jgi:hypothetical protein